MVKELRKKFVIVTALMMIVAFAVLAFFEKQYDDYWWDYEYAKAFEAFADSGYFQREDDSDEMIESFAEEYSEGYMPIIGVVVDNEGNILSYKVAGDIKKAVIDDGLVKGIYKIKDSAWKYGDYLFTSRPLDNDRTLIIYSDVNDENSIRDVIELLIIIMGSLIMVVIVTAILSRFITEPARLAIDREKQFVSDASHELKTPLSSININAQAAAQEYPENVNISNIVSESARMAKLIEKMLTLSMLEETTLQTHEKVNLSELIEGMVLTYESTAYDKEIAFENSIEDQLYVRGDSSELEQLAVILLDNAIKNTDQQGRITVLLRNLGNKIEFKVTNTGKGIPPENLPHIFERYYTLDQSRANSSFGLGLPIAKAIMSRHGGSIAAESEVDKETSFISIFRKI